MEIHGGKMPSRYDIALGNLPDPEELKKKELQKRIEQQKAYVREKTKQIIVRVFRS